MKLRIARPPFTGASYRPRSHIVTDHSERAICGFKPKKGWEKTINKNIEFVECLNCLGTHIRYFENLFARAKRDF